MPVPSEALKTGTQAPGVDAFSKIGSPSAAPAPSNFENMLGTFVRDVNAKQIDSSNTVGALLRGENVPLHQAMVSMEEASVSFQLMVEVRNKLLEGYQELLRMQI